MMSILYFAEVLKEWYIVFPFILLIQQAFILLIQQVKWSVPQGLVYFFWSIWFWVFQFYQVKDHFF